MDDPELEARLSRRLHTRFDAGSASPGLRQRVAVSLSPPTRRVGPAWRGFASLALAAAIVIIALAVGLRYVTRPNVEASPSPSSTTTATPSPASSAGTGIVDITQPSMVRAIRWSPDSQHLLIAGDGLEVFDRHGSEVMAVPGVSTAEWVGSGAVAAGVPNIANVGYGSVSIDSLAGGLARLPGTYVLDLVGASNELALVPASAKSPDGTGTFVVWRGGQLEGPFPGTPLAWSTDGRRLIATVGAVAVGQSLPSISGVVEAAAGTLSGGRIRVWTFPGAVPDTAVSTVTVDPRYRPIFSPDGQTIAVPCGLSAASPDCAATVIDTTTMQARVAGNQPPGLGLSWLPSGELLLASRVYPQPGPLPAWSPSGTRQTPFTGAWGVAGATGTVALESAAMGEAGATNVVAATGELLASMPSAIELDWSPDGSCLLVRGDPQALLHLYCRPSPTPSSSPSPSSKAELTATPAPIPTLSGTVPPESTSAWTGLGVQQLRDAPAGLGQVIRWSGGYVASVLDQAIYTSRDGRSWTRLPEDTLGLAAATPPGSTIVMTGAACGQGVILLTQDYLGAESTWFASDGVYWTPQPAPPSLGWVRGAATAAGRTFITSDSGLWQTVDCRTWQQAKLPGPADAGADAVASFGDAIVAVGGVGPRDGGEGDDEPAAWWSTDGKTWQRAAVPHKLGYAFTDVEAGSGGLVGQVYTVGLVPGGSSYLLSADGRSWTTGFTDPLGLQPSGEGFGDPNGVLQGDGSRLLLWGDHDPTGSQDPQQAWISPDGRQWTRLSLSGSGASAVTKYSNDVVASLMRDGLLFSGDAGAATAVSWFGTATP